MSFRLFAKHLPAALTIVLAATGAWAAPPTYQLSVDGLSCPFCAYGVEKKLGALAGVEGLETRIEDGTVIVTMQDGATLDEASARQAVKAAGFSLRKFEQLRPPAPGAPAGAAK